MEESQQGEDYRPLEFTNRIDLGQLQESVAQIKTELGSVIIGQQEMIELLIISILANGHSLIEGVPGVAKTVTAKLLAKTLNVDFSRIQFTPDLMPSDILGTSIFNVKTSEFEFKKGPLFSNIILIDEINRAPAKTQAALFEAMAERQITMDGLTYEMSPPFLVFATQNPIEQEGTYRLPEAQLDRFLFKIKVNYPSLEEEIAILESKHHQKNKNLESLITSVLSADQIASYQEVIKEIIIEDNLMKYIAGIVHNTRNNANLYLGASPRASIAIMDASKALAAINGRDFVTPDDIKKVATPILGHRVILTPEREMEGFTPDKVIKQIMETIEIPR
ncbi:AAA family ATPase [Arenibacter troitsensis]|uniref:MoxR-like ATPase n=1 Tax=Arenibacter troitsensis TaxID=188872 RepID=A0A1X7I938_9FLAO|nr:MoxR family ATPase [Arenibacter troitsensis]MDX1769593.1 MoxR family ATPase [Arenibacter troitsensis]SMG11185.1 MoxR-like ATPase [Arenibacter troitsensis]